MYKILTILTSLLLVLFGAEWQSLNGPPVGRVDDINMGWDPIHGYYAIYAADQTHKLYKSTNEGEYWDSIPTIPPNPNIINPTCVITTPNNAQVVYIGKNGTTPIWWSQDGGVNWEGRSGIPPNNYITNPNPSCFGIDPLSIQHIYLGCTAQLSEHSLFFSPDGGANWFGRGNQECDIKCILVVHEPASAESLFMATSQGIYSSTDGGFTWALCQSGSFSSICNFVENNTRIFYAVQGSSSEGVYRSVDGNGAVWSPLSNSPPHPICVNARQTTPHYIYCGTQFDYVYRSTNNGSSWEQINYHFCDSHTRCILTHPSDPYTVFAGTDDCFYKSTDGGNTWQEKTDGRRITQCSYDLSLALPDAIFVSYHGTSTWKLENSSWTLRFTYPPETAVPPQRAGANGDVLIDDVDHTRIYTTSEVRLGIDTDYICRSTDGGWTWENVTPQNLLLNQKSLASDPGSNDTVYIVGESPPQFLKSKDYGVTWELHTINYNPPDVTPPFYSIDISSTGPKITYLGDITFGVSKSTDGGQTWSYNMSGLPLSRIDALAVDPDKPEIIYAGTLDGIFKSIDNGVTWQDLGLATSVKDIEIDPSEPTIFYAILEGVTQDEIVCTVDRGRQTFTVTENLPDACYDVEIDRHYSDAVYIATEKGLYNYTPDFNKHLVSSSNMATSYNNGKKMITGMADIWITYESGGVIYAVHSIDGGCSWSKKMEIGFGYNPAIASKAELDPPAPCIVWRAQNTRDTLYFARYVSGDDWTTPLQIVNADNDYGAPSFVIGADNIGRIAYDMNGKSYYTEFDIDNPTPITPEDIGRGINPSIGYMTPGANNPEIHVVWEDNLKIKYRSRTVGGTWGSEETVFSSNSHRPSIEVKEFCLGSNLDI